MAFVIGISGATRSGKSTLAKALVEHIGSTKTVVLSQDSFASHALASHHESGFEATESVDHAKLRGALVKSAGTKGKVVIVEGFRAFHDLQLVAAMHILLWLDVSREVCLARKTATSSAENFATHAWPRHEEYREHCFGSAGPLASNPPPRARLVLNGERSGAALLQQAVTAITACQKGGKLAVQPSPGGSSKAPQIVNVQPSARALARSREAQAGNSARGERARRGQETLSILGSGGYVEPTSGDWVDASAAIAACVASSEFVPASSTLEATSIASASASVASATTPRAEGRTTRTCVEVADEDTMTAARRLTRHGLTGVAPNFASARNPGGGWLTGAEAQEESLARSSALVAALTAPGPCAAHYADANGSRDALYTHDMIYSPAVPVFRDEASLELLPQPWPLAFISAAAPNAGVAVRKHAVSAKAVEAIYAERAERVLALAHKRGHDAIVLGAWGCGVFQNDPPMVARVFGRLLNGRFRGRFRVVAFPILGRDANPSVCAPFDALASEGDHALPEVEPEAGLPAATPDAVPTPPTVSERSLSEAYGAGASQYDEAALTEWKARGQLAADAAKRKDWQAASAEFAACVELRPDWEKGYACLARVQAKVAAAAQQQPEHQPGVVSAEAEAGAVAEATKEGAGAAGRAALELESNAYSSDAYSVAAVGKVVPSFNVGRGVALEDTAVDLTRVEAALRQLRPSAGSALAVLTLSGALNPVHEGHVQMLEAAAAAITAAGNHHAVLFGFLAPSSKGYLQHKLGVEALDLRERCELCSAAVEDRPSLGVLDWGITSSHAIAQGTEALLTKGFPAFCFTSFQVVGADFARKASLVEKVAGGRAGQYVCVKRRGLAREDAEWLRALEGRHACGKLPSGFVLAEAPPKEASSTRVRELCKAGQWNALAASGLLHPAVVNALIERRWLQG